MPNYNNYSTYGNPYSPPQMNQYTFVNGIEGAKAFIVQPNQTVLLMDNNNPICFMKQANGIGQSSIRCFKLIEVSENDLKDTSNDEKYVLKSEFNALVNKLNEFLNAKSQKEVNKDA